ncbi:conserved membrane hypothetical protein [Burkholderiales bacterium]|nr:conserved membrane hypothetical protein [Burkholderiales bacterium]
MSSASLGARTPAAPTLLAAGTLLALVAWAWRLAAVHGEHEMIWGQITVGAILAGFAALGWLRSARVGMTAPQIMLLLGAVGMVGGLAHDEHAGGFAALVSLCRAGPGSFLSTLRLHWQLLPGMHLGMIAGGLATVPLLRGLRRGCRRQFCARLLQNLACSAWMVAGMGAGTLVFGNLAAWAGERSAPAVLGGMFVGMVWGMVASVAMYRLWFGLRSTPG